jgi:low temperature requirement protein LtrA
VWRAHRDGGSTEAGEQKAAPVGAVTDMGTLLADVMSSALGGPGCCRHRERAALRCTREILSGPLGIAVSKERARKRPGARPDLREDDRAVGALELFFDLVFVYAMSQVTHVMLTHVSWSGFGHGVLALAVIWWAWVCYAWLTNTSAETGPFARTLIFLAMSAMLVAAVSLPDAFGDGALMVGVALLVVRLLHVVLFLMSARGQPEVRSAFTRLLPSLLIGPALLVVAAFQSSPYREALWLCATAIDFGGPVLVGMGGFRVRPAYFVERHGAIIIIALGESIIEVGAGASANLHRASVLVAVAMGVLISAAMWWAYFGLKEGAAARLRRARGLERARLARDAYSYLHLPLVAGIVFYALGVEEAVATVDEPLEPLLGLALCGGVALFFAAEVAYRWRDHHELATDRLVASAGALVVTPLALVVPALATLVALTGVSAAFVAWEVWRRPQIGGVRPA